MNASHSLQNNSLLPQRVVLAILGTLAIAVSYTIRSCLSMAIVKMVVPVNQTGQGDKYQEGIGHQYDWSQSQQGFILSSFYIGYVIAHIPGGLIAQKFGGKWTCSLGILCMAFFNAITPKAVELGGYLTLIALRILVGIGGGTTYPALSVMLAVWVPEKERGKLGSIVFGGGQIGCLLSFYFSGLLLSKFPWEMVYYFWSIIAIVWFIVFTFFCYNDPGSHPFVSEKELNYLKAELGQTKRNHNLPRTPWSKILTSIPVIAMAICLIGHDWIFYILSADLPKYLTDVLHLNVYDAGLYSAMPYLLMWMVSLLSGFMSDFMVNRKFVTITQARKIFTGIGSIFPAIFLVGASYANYNVPLAIFLFTLTMGFIGNVFTGVKVNALDLSPNYAGSLMALTNGLAGTAGVVVLPVIGWLTPDSSLQQWRFVFWITFAVSILRTVVFLIWGSAEVQPWNDPDKITNLVYNAKIDSIQNGKDKLIPR